MTADGNLAAESAGVLGVLGDFHLLHLLTQGGTVTMGEEASVYRSMGHGFADIVGAFAASSLSRPDRLLASTKTRYPANQIGMLFRPKAIRQVR